MLTSIDLQFQSSGGWTLDECHATPGQPTPWKRSPIAGVLHWKGLFSRGQPPGWQQVESASAPGRDERSQEGRNPASSPARSHGCQSWRLLAAHVHAQWFRDVRAGRRSGRGEPDGAPSSGPAPLAPEFVQRSGRAGSLVAACLVVPPASGSTNPFDAPRRSIYHRRFPRPPDRPPRSRSSLAAEGLDLAAKAPFSSARRR